MVNPQNMFLLNNSCTLLNTSLNPNPSLTSSLNSSLSPSGNYGFRHDRYSLSNLFYSTCQFDFKVENKREQSFTNEAICSDY